MTGVIGGAVVGFGLITGLVIADAPLAVMTGALFALTALLGALARFRGRLRSRGRGTRLPPLRGRLRAAGARHPWTTMELAALGNDVALRRLLKAMPDARREGNLP